MVRVFANYPGDLGSIPGRVIPKTQKMVLDATLLKTQHYKVRIEGKVEQSRERSSAPPLHFGVVAIEKGAFGLPSTTVTKLYIYIYIYQSNEKSLQDELRDTTTNFKILTMYTTSIMFHAICLILR